ncbi:hypothetical protein AAHB54_13835, partial [Bacillus cereus]
LWPFGTSWRRCCFGAFRETNQVTCFRILSLKTLSRFSLLDRFTGDNSTNIQAKNVTVQQNGLSYTAVKEVAMDVFKSNFYDLGKQ